MAAVAQHFEAFKARLDKVLHEKNKVNDVLEKIEQKTGVKRLYIVIGKNKLFVKVCISYSPPKHKKQFFI